MGSLLLLNIIFCMWISKNVCCEKTWLCPPPPTVPLTLDACKFIAELISRSCDNNLSTRSFWKIIYWNRIQYLLYPVQLTAFEYFRFFDFYDKHRARYSYFIMETKEAWQLSLLVFICCLAVLVRANVDDDVAFSAGGSDTTKFGQAKSVRYVN